MAFFLVHTLIGEVLGGFEAACMVIELCVSVGYLQRNRRADLRVVLFRALVNLIQCIFNNGDIIAVGYDYELIAVGTVASSDILESFLNDMCGFGDMAVALCVTVLVVDRFEVVDIELDNDAVGLVECHLFFLFMEGGTVCETCKAVRVSHFLHDHGTFFVNGEPCTLADKVDTEQRYEDKDAYSCEVACVVKSVVGDKIAGKIACNTDSCKRHGNDHGIHKSLVELIVPYSSYHQVYRHYQGYNDIDVGEVQHKVNIAYTECGESQRQRIIDHRETEQDREENGLPVVGRACHKGNRQVLFGKRKSPETGLFCKSNFF